MQLMSWSDVINICIALRPQLTNGSAACLCISIFLCLPSYAQSNDTASSSQAEFQPLALARQNDVDIKIDGVVDEPDWNNATTITEFRLVNGDIDDDKLIPYQTDTRVFYDDRALYVAFQMEQPKSTYVKIHSPSDGGSLRRDFVTIALDASGEGKYGFYFTQFLGGSKRDGLLSPPNNWNRSWNGAWLGRVSEHQNGWAAEFMIPWSILNMPASDKDRQMGLLVSRRLAHVGEYFSWPAIHQSLPRFLSILRPVLLRDVQPRQQLSVFPYIASNMDQKENTTRENWGGDLFWRPSTNFQLTATARPDFGTVEADDVIINLSAFETFFPDRRLFFTEGREIFYTRTGGTSVSGSPANVFHSRRIGDRPIVPEVAKDVWLDYSRLRQGTDLLVAAKGVGQVGRFRYGILGASEDDATFGATRGDEKLTITSPGRDFAIGRFVYEDTSSGTRKIALLSAARFHPTGDHYAHAVDSRYQSADGKLEFESEIYASVVPERADGYGGVVAMRYSPNYQLTHGFSYLKHDTNLDVNATGYLSRNGLTNYGYQLSHTAYETKRFRNINTSFGLSLGYNEHNERILSSIGLSRFLGFKNLGGLYMDVRQDLETVNDYTAYRAGSFNARPTTAAVVDWVSDQSRKFYYSVWGNYITEQMEGRFVFAGLRLVFQPIESFTFNVRLSKGHRDGWLLYQGDRRFTMYRSIGPAATAYTEYFFTARQHIRFDLDWRLLHAKDRKYFVLPEGSKELEFSGYPAENEPNGFVISRMSMQLRYHWEIAPLSDLYIVYTRTGSLRELSNNSYSKTFFDTFGDADTANLAAKIRYRFGL